MGLTVIDLSSLALKPVDWLDAILICPVPRNFLDNFYSNKKSFYMDRPLTKVNEMNSV